MLALIGYIGAIPGRVWSVARQNPALKWAIIALGVVLALDLMLEVFVFSTRGNEALGASELVTLAALAVAILLGVVWPIRLWRDSRKLEMALEASRCAAWVAIGMRLFSGALAAAVAGFLAWSVVEAKKLYEDVKLVEQTHHNCARSHACNK